MYSEANVFVTAKYLCVSIVNEPLKILVLLCDYPNETTVIVLFHKKSLFLSRSVYNRVFPFCGGLMTL